MEKNKGFAAKHFHCVMDCITSFFSAEWFLKKFRWENGGPVVLSRAIWTTCWMYSGALLLLNIVDPTRLKEFDVIELRVQITETFTWLGAIFIGTYTVFYSRYASQWNYLSQVYNEIKRVEVSGVRNKSALAEWKAGFIEDADDLHLVRKRMFASTILWWGKEPAVQESFKKHVAAGVERYQRILVDAQNVFHG